MGGRGSRQTRNRPMQGDDERYDLLLDFKDAVFGIEKDIEVTRLEGCTTCSGSGAKPGTTPTSCKTCGGQGQVMTTAQTPLGDFRQVSMKLDFIVLIRHVKRSISPHVITKPQFHLESAIP